MTSLVAIDETCSTGYISYLIIFNFRDHPLFSALSQAYREYSLYTPPPQKCTIKIVLTKLVSCTSKVAKTNILKAYNWIYPLPVSYFLYSCENNG